MTDHVLPDLHGGALDDLADPLLGDGARAAVHRQPLQGAAQQAWLAAAGGLAAVADRVAGAYLGLALGDALGATVEFMTPREIALRHGVHQQICGGGWLRLKAGQVTDDTTMSLALGEGLLHGAAASDGRSLDLGEVAESFLTWWRARPVDCGNTCRRGILRYLHGGTLQGPPQEGDAGNGAAMRVLPAAIATLGDPLAFTAIALGQARITHHHPLSDSAVLGLGGLAQALIAGADEADITRRIERWQAAQPLFRHAPYPGRASAYVVDTVQTVLDAYTRHDDFRQAVVTAVNRGDDADTTGALVGMLAGARCGARALPRDWLQRLQPTVRSAVTGQAAALLALALQPLPGEAR